jgi:hypothetical protein
VPPASALGTGFAVTRSPERCVEPGLCAVDIWRVLADKPGTVDTTNLPAPNDTFTLGENEYREFEASSDFVLEATRPVLVAQFLVGQNSNAGTGDPSLTFMPPIDQARSDYVFLVPETYYVNYVVVGRQQGTAVRLDGEAVPGEFGACTAYPIGAVGGTSYEALRCSLSAGVHDLVADQPVTLIEYGYGGTGSIAYVGGAELRRINIE